MIKTYEQFAEENPQDARDLHAVASEEASKKQKGGQGRLDSLFHGLERGRIIRGYLSDPKSLQRELERHRSAGLLPERKEPVTIDTMLEAAARKSPGHQPDSLIHRKEPVMAKPIDALPILAFAQLPEEAQAAVSAFVEKLAARRPPSHAGVVRECDVVALKESIAEKPVAVAIIMADPQGAFTHADVPHEFPRLAFDRLPPKAQHAVNEHVVEVSQAAGAHYLEPAALEKRYVLRERLSGDDETVKGIQADRAKRIKDSRLSPSNGRIH